MLRWKPVCENVFCVRIQSDGLPWIIVSDVSCFFMRPHSETVEVKLRRSRNTKQDIQFHSWLCLHKYCSRSAACLGTTTIWSKVTQQKSKCMPFMCTIYHAACETRKVLKFNFAIHALTTGGMLCLSILDRSNGPVLVWHQHNGRRAWNSGKACNGRTRVQNTHNTPS